MPTWVSIFRCHSLRQVFVISAAARVTFCGFVEEEESCESSWVRLVRCCSVYSNDGRPSSAESEVHCSKQRESAIELSVLSAAKTA